MHALRRRAVLTALFLLAAAPAAADVLTFDFDDYQDVTVGQSWQDQGLTFSLTAQGSNPVAISTQYGLVLGTVVLTVDLAPLSDVRSIETRIVTTSSFTPTRLALYDEIDLLDQAESAEYNRSETLRLESGGAAARWYRLTSDNSRLESVVIRHGPVGGEQRTWSGVKALYR